MCQVRSLDLELQNGRRIDNTSVSIAKTAGACVHRLLSEAKFVSYGIRTPFLGGFV